MALADGPESRRDGVNRSRHVADGSDREFNGSHTMAIDQTSENESEEIEAPSSEFERTDRTVDDAERGPYLDTDSDRTVGTTKAKGTVVVDPDTMASGAAVRNGSSCVDRATVFADPVATDAGSRSRLTVPAHDEDAMLTSMRTSR